MIYDSVNNAGNYFDHKDKFFRAISYAVEFELALKQA